MTLLIGVFSLAVIGTVALATGLRDWRDRGTLDVDHANHEPARSLRSTGDVGAVADGPRVSVPTTRLLDAPISDLTSQFLRKWRVSGPEICKGFRDAGIETTEWRAASMRSVSYECYFQRIYERDEVRPLRSTFLRVRGNAWGDILEISGRIVGPKTDEQGRLDPSLMRIFEVIVGQASWGDFADTLVPIGKLVDVRFERFGAYFDFTRELSQENSYNFTLVLSQVSDQQARTRAYFSEDRWMVNPDYRRTRPAIPMLSSR